MTPRKRKDEQPTEPEPEVVDTPEEPPPEAEQQAAVEAVDAPATLVVGTGSPPVSPNFGAPRFSEADPADFPTQGNAITDTFDAQAAKRGAIADADIAPTAAIQLAKIALGVGADVLRTGDLKLYAGASPGSGWVPCDGRQLDRGVYAALFAQIGVSFGAGDGSGANFNVPDLRGVFPVGAGQGTGLTNRVLGSRGGEETHLLAGGEMPVHAHGVNDPQHEHALIQSTLNEQGGTGTYSPGAYGLGWTSQTSPAATGISIQNAGGGGAHNNMPPFVAIGFAIKL